MGWIDRIEMQLGHACNGDVSRKDGMVFCEMDNGSVKIFETPDGTKSLIVKKDDGSSARIEATESKDPYDEPVITRSLGGSLELLTRFGKNPSIIVKQEGRRFGEVSFFAENEKNRMSLYGYY